jgi:hypothetical protein
MEKGGIILYNVLVELTLIFYHNKKKTIIQ